MSSKATKLRRRLERKFGSAEAFIHRIASSPKHSERALIRAAASVSFLYEDWKGVVTLDRFQRKAYLMIAFSFAQCGPHGWLERKPLLEYAKKRLGDYYGYKDPERFFKYNRRLDYGK